MSTVIRHLNYLPPAELDRYLEKGWRTTGQAVYNCNFLWLESGEMISVLPMRLQLKGYQFSKSMRKMMRRNLDRFQVVYGPAINMNSEAYRVNLAYLQQNPDKSLPNLDYHITGNYLRRVLNTWECRIYDGCRLAAISYFDLGNNSAYGKAGIYDPAYSQFSLGLFTMGLEVEFCQRRGLSRYFPGYVSDDNPMFNYKHRLGKMDFFDVVSQQWLPYKAGEVRQQPIRIIRAKLENAIDLLKASSDLQVELMVYPYLDARYASLGYNEYLDVPLFVLLKQTGHDRYHLLTYLPQRDCFQVLKVQESQFGINRGNFDRSGIKNCSFAFIVEKALIDGITSADEVVARYISSYCI